MQLEERSRARSSLCGELNRWSLVAESGAAGGLELRCVSAQLQTRLEELIERYIQLLKKLEVYLHTFWSDFGVTGVDPGKCSIQLCEVVPHIRLSESSSRNSIVQGSRVTCVSFCIPPVSFSYGCLHELTEKH